MVCKTKSSKRNAYSIKSNFMGALYNRGVFFLLPQESGSYPLMELLQTHTGGERECRGTDRRMEAFYRRGQWTIEEVRMKK